jgi:hypothetical protein
MDKEIGVATTTIGIFGRFDIKRRVDELIWR